MFQSDANEVNEALGHILMYIKKMLASDTPATSPSSTQNAAQFFKAPIDWVEIIKLFQDGVVSTLLTRINDAYPENCDEALQEKRLAVESISGIGFENVVQKQKRRREEEQEEGSSGGSQRAVRPRRK